MRQNSKSERQGWQVIVTDIQPFQKLETMDLVRKFCDLVLPEIQHSDIDDILQLVRLQSSDFVGSKMKLFQIDTMSQDGYGGQFITSQV